MDSRVLYHIAEDADIFSGGCVENGVVPFLDLAFREIYGSIQIVLSFVCAHSVWDGPRGWCIV